MGLPEDLSRQPRRRSPWISACWRAWSTWRFCCSSAVVHCRPHLNAPYRHESCEAFVKVQKDTQIVFKIWTMSLHRSVPQSLTCIWLSLHSGVFFPIAPWITSQARLGDILSRLCCGNLGAMLKIHRPLVAAKNFPDGFNSQEGFTFLKYYDSPDGSSVSKEKLRCQAAST